MQGGSLRLDGLHLRGASRAGQQTWFRVDPPGLALDVGRGAAALVGAQRIFVSHGHLDHSLGLPWLVSQRRMQGLEKPIVYCREEEVATFADLLATAGRLERRPLEAEFVGLRPGHRHRIGPALWLEAFEVDHVIPALGCHLIREKTRLAEKLRGMSADRIRALRAAGEEVEERRLEYWLSYCGDTGPGVFESEPRVFEARCLVIECTFVSPTTRDAARRFGHLHISDFIERQDLFRNEVLVLTHLSQRHRVGELRHMVDRSLPRLKPRVEIMV